MKNLFIALGVLAMIGATSCKKEYTCECTSTVTNDAGDKAESTVTSTIKDTKKKAKDSCEAGSKAKATDGMGNTAETKCVLK